MVKKYGCNSEKERVMDGGSSEQVNVSFIYLMTVILWEE